MPCVLIEVRQQYSVQKEIDLINAVHEALKEAFNISPYNKNIRLVVYEPHRFAIPSDKKYPEKYTLISIDCFVGRTLESKRTLYRLIVEKLVNYDIPKDHVKVLVRELPKENWGIQGGQAACDVDSGF